MQTKPQKNHTLIDTRKLTPAKKSKIKSEATKPETKGRKPRNKKSKMPTKKTMPKGKMMKIEKAKPSAKSSKMKFAGSMMNKGYKKK